MTCLVTLFDRKFQVVKNWPFLAFLVNFWPHYPNWLVIWTIPVFWSWVEYQTKFVVGPKCRIIKWYFLWCIDRHNLMGLTLQILICPLGQRKHNPRHPKYFGCLQHPKKSILEIPLDGVLKFFLPIRPHLWRCYTSYWWLNWVQNHFGPSLFWLNQCQFWNSWKGQESRSNSHLGHIARWHCLIGLMGMAESKQ